MAADTVKALPADLFHLFTAELASRNDFGSLYNCIVSSKHLANNGAIAALYRISHDAPVKGGSEGEALSFAEQHVVVQKWSILWRTIILSALGKTFYPYCRHLRMLDVRDLNDLLEDDRFRSKTAEHFFSGELARFHAVLETPVKTITRSRAPRLDTRKVVSAIGDEITQHAPLLEVLTEPTIGDILSTALLVWAPRLEHLESLELYDGKALADETVRDLLSAHCHNLQRLSIYQYASDDADHHLATFLSSRVEHSLTSFINFSNCGLGPETMLALNSHGKSLRTLRLALGEDGMLALGLLQACTALESLAIESIRPSVDLKATQNDIYLEIVEWLKTCNSLRDVSLSKIISAPDLLTSVLLNQNVKLQNLQINSDENSMYVVKDHHDFHQALTQQPTLRQLSLRADPDPTSRDDKEVLMNAFCSLTNLERLNLTRISDYFSEPEIDLLTQHLPNLEELYIGGYGITDNVWNNLAQLRSLKTVTFYGLTKFTADGILEYIDILGDGNSGLLLSIDNADPDWAIGLEGQDLVKEALAVKVDGRFEYQLLRDPNMFEFDSSDSD